MNDPWKLLLAATIAAGFAAAPDAAYSQARAKPETEAPHWADSPPRKAAAESREATLKRIQLEQEAQKEKAERRKADQEAAEAAKRKQAGEAEARRLAALEKEKDDKRRRREMEARCVIKPVMTDTDIENCRVLSR